MFAFICKNYGPMHLYFRPQHVTGLRLNEPRTLVAIDALQGGR